MGVLIAMTYYLLWFPGNLGTLHVLTPSDQCHPGH